MVRIQVYKLCQVSRKKVSCFLVNSKKLVCIEHYQWLSTNVSRVSVLCAWVVAPWMPTRLYRYNLGQKINCFCRTAKRSTRAHELMVVSISQGKEKQSSKAFVYINLYECLRAVSLLPFIVLVCLSGNSGTVFSQHKDHVTLSEMHSKN
jgi:hypothetical protein